MPGESIKMESIDENDMISEDDIQDAMDDESLPPDRFCFNHESVKTLKKKKTSSRCFDGVNLKARERARNTTLTLITECPDMGDLTSSRYRWLGGTILNSIAGITKDDVRAKAMEMVDGALKTRVSPVDGRVYDPKKTVDIDEWRDILRIAKGLPPTYKRETSVFISPADREYIGKALRSGIASARRAGTDDEVRLLEYILKALGPKGR